MPRFTPAHTLAQAQTAPLIPVFYHAQEAYARDVLAACYQGGIRMFEFTNRGPQAFAIFASLQRFVEAEYPDLLLGAGTIFSAEDAERFINAGADFIIQPIINPEVAAVCQRQQIAWLPGAQTLNEVYQAQQLGATLVKLFPGSLLGPAYLKLLRGSMPTLPIMVTGGVQPTVPLLTEWREAGATCVGIDARLLLTENPVALTAQVTALQRALLPTVG